MLAPPGRAGAGPKCGGRYEEGPIAAGPATERTKPPERAGRCEPFPRISMEIEDLLTPEAVIARLKAGSKKQALQELARKATQITGLPERAIFDVLLERERLGTTGVGNGIAIPHGKLAELNRIVGVFARLDRPIDFDAIDERPVDLLFLLLAPESAGADHLKALARVSRLFRDRGTCEKLRGTDHADALYAILTSQTVAPTG